MSIKCEVTQYTILKKEKYFEALRRNLLVSARTHYCEEVFDPHHIDGHDEDSQKSFQ